MIPNDIQIHNLGNLLNIYIFLNAMRKYEMEILQILKNRNMTENIYKPI